MRYVICTCRCVAVVVVGIFLTSCAGYLEAGDTVLLEARTLSRNGAELAVVLPNGAVALSSKVVTSCVSGGRHDEDILVFDLAGGECLYILAAERDAEPMLRYPAIDTSGATASISILECLTEHGGVLIGETGALTVCFDWYSCAELTPVILGPDVVCSGSSITLDAGPDFASYVWVPGDETTPNIDVSPSGDTEYVVTVTDEWLCTGTDTHSVTVVPLPQPEITGPASVCQGEEVTLEATPGFSSYSWSPGSFTTRTLTEVPATNTQYSVTVTEEQGCSGTASHTVVVNPNPTPVISGPTSLCAGASATLDAGTGYTSYLWTPGGETTRIITITQGSAENYGVSVTDADGCTATSPVHVVDVSSCVPEIFADDFETGDTFRWSASQ